MCISPLLLIDPVMVWCPVSHRFVRPSAPVLPKKTEFVPSFRKGGVARVFHASQEFLGKKGRQLLMSGWSNEDGME